ncbi:MAG: FG-GAP-like repeat-containing protein [Balneolaceae bacterium]
MRAKTFFPVNLLLFALTLVWGGCNSQPELEWVEEDGYRWANLQTGWLGSDGFRQLSSNKTGVSFRNDVRQELMEKNRHYLNGSGVAVADVDGDGWVDIYFARLDGPNKLFINNGNYRFEDVTEQAGVAHEGYNSTGVAFADVNGNGYPDLLVSSLSDQNVLYMNDGTGLFTRMENSGLGESSGAHTLALADVNGNGYLDLYITNYHTRTVRDLFSEEELSLENTVESVEGELQVLPEFKEYYTIIETAEGPFRNEIGQKDELYFNRGNGKFEKVDDLEHFLDERGNERGLSEDWGLTATFRDVNDDGLPDLYVANDFWTPDRFWINRGDGVFRAIQTESIRNMSYSSMGVDFSDINRDGYLDFTVTEMLSQEHQRRLRQHSENQAEYEGRTMHNRNSVYLNRGDSRFGGQDPTFAEISYYSGLHASEWSWATYFMDVDLDGYEDLIVATGNAYDYQDMDTQIAMGEGSAETGMRQGSDITRYPLLESNNKIFRNNTDLTFTDQSKEWGFEEKDLSMGMALADLNNDGAQDLIINRLNEEAAIYENRTRAPRIAVRLKGEGRNTFGIGAEVILEGGSRLPEQQKQLTAGGNYLSGSQALVVFAADEEFSEHVITVEWPSGKVSRVGGVEANRIYEIDESGAVYEEESESGDPLSVSPIFEDISALLGHRHHENEYDDFRFAPLLPQKISRQGPGVAWVDITRDGRDDLIIGSGKGGEPALFENRGEGLMEPIEMDPITWQVPGDQTAILSWREEGETRVVMGSANYEQGNSKAASAYIYSVDENGSVRQDSIPGILSATGPIAAADVDGNGYVDLFIGGRFKPGQYPVDADSRLFLNDGEEFELDTMNSKTFTELGLVTGAVFSDLTGNGRPDLLVSTEWGSLRLFENRAGTFVEVTSGMGLSRYKGWWKGVTTGDFTGNGLPDIVAANIGLNSPYQLHDGEPIRIYFDDLNWDGRLNIVEAYYDEEVGDYVPRRKLHDFESVRTILRNVRTHTEFARSSLDQIFDRDFEDVPYKEINTLEHMIFMNTGEGFEARPLPADAQFSAGFHAGVADVENNGTEDLFLSQNYFSFPRHIPRLDAGRGLLLKGNGEGSFTAADAVESGIRIHGEQRGAAFGDMNADGRADLVVSQNSGRTKLFLNQTESAGIRIRLEGPSGNRDAIGSSIRGVFEDGTKGPRREIQAGGGYWSQSSKIQVLGGDKPLSAIEVKWFDGRSETVAISDPSVGELLIEYIE